MKRSITFRRRQLLSSGVTITLAAALVACGGASTNDVVVNGDLIIDGELIADEALLEGAASEGTLVIYGNRIESHALPVLDQFTEDTGISTEYVRLAPDRLYERVMTEYGGDVLEADAIFISDVTLIDQMREAGVLAAHTIPGWEDFPAEYRQADGYYYASLLGLMLIAYNDAVVDPSEVPTTWEELIDDRWADRLAITPASVGGSAWALALFQRQTYGIEFWEGLAELQPAIYPSAAGLGEDLVRGEVEIGLLPETVAFRHQQEGAPIGVVWPSDGVPVFPGYSAITSVGDNPNSAKVLMNWMHAMVGQVEIGQSAGSFSVLPDAPEPVIDGVDLPSANEMQLIVASDEDWLTLRDEWVEDWNRIFGYTP